MSEERPFRILHFGIFQFLLLYSKLRDVLVYLLFAKGFQFLLLYSPISVLVVLELIGVFASFNSYYCIQGSGDRQYNITGGKISFNSYYCIRYSPSRIRYWHRRVHFQFLLLYSSLTLDLTRDKHATTFNSYYCIPGSTPEKLLEKIRGLSILTIVFSLIASIMAFKSFSSLSILTIVFLTAQ